jgi:MtrB/PioB family decaheme-associated outer membrane protein
MSMLKPNGLANVNDPSDILSRGSLLQGKGVTFPLCSPLTRRGTSMYLGSTRAPQFHTSAYRARWTATSFALVAAIAAALHPKQTRAEDVPRPDTSTWSCEQCPFKHGHEGEYNVGASYVSDDAARFGNATGYDKEGAYVLADGNGLYSEEGQRLEWELEDLGLDSRAVNVKGGNPGTYDYHVGYSELPYRRYDTSQTPFRKTGDELLTLPAGWVPAGTTTGFTALDASLLNRNIESDRSTFDIGAGYRGIEHLRFDVDFQRSSRDGWGIASGPFYTTSTLLAAPIDDHTDTARFGATYGRENWSATLSWLGSFYSNSDQQLLWDNPYTGGGQGAQARAPGNDAQTVALEGVYRFSPAQTVLSASASFGEVRQDALFLPYTINPAVPVRDLPQANLDGKIDTTHVDVGITSHPWAFLRLKGTYRYDDHDNRTSVEQWTRTITDLFDSGETQTNTPYSFKREALQLSAAARLTQWDWLKKFEFEGGYDHIKTDRTLQESPSDTTESGWGRVRWRPAGGTELTLKAGAERREPDGYDLTVAQANEQNPLLRKYTLAYRYRSFAQLDARVNLPGQPVSIGGQIFYASDDYTESQLGLRKNDDRRFAADVTWAINDKTSVYVQGGYEDQDLAIRGSETFTTVDWTSQHQDNFQSIDAGVKYADPDKKFDASVSLRYAKGAGHIDVDSDYSGSGAYPSLRTDLQGAEVQVGYRLNPATDLRLTLRYEDYSSADWALNGVEPATVPTVLTFGANPDNYSVYLVSLSIRYSFGRAAATPAETTSEEK